MQLRKAWRVLASRACFWHGIKMMTWLSLLAPLLVWAVHFGGVYLCAEFAPGALNVMVPILTVFALGANLHFFFMLPAAAAWHNTIVRGGALLSSTAICWQALPIYLGSG